MRDKQAFDLGVISDKQDVVRAVRSVAEDFGYTTKSWTNVEDFLQNQVSCKLMFFTTVDSRQLAEVAQDSNEKVEAITFACPEAAVLAALTRRLPDKNIEFLQRTGMELFLYVEEIFETSKLPFLLKSIIGAKYFPIKHSDLLNGKNIPFDVYHILPLNNKFLRIARRGATLSDKKMAKMEEVGEFFIERDDVEYYRIFLANTLEDSSDNHLRICRARYLEFILGHMSFIQELIASEEVTSFEEGFALFGRLSELAEDLVEAFSSISVAAVWDIINNAAVGDYGAISRAPAVAAYVAYFSSKLGPVNKKLAVSTSLIFNLGLLNVPLEITRQVNKGRLEQLDEDEIDIYRAYPILTIDLLLNKKIPIPPEVKGLILNINSRADGKGFPLPAAKAKLDFNSQIIAFCMKFDELTHILLGKERVSQRDVLKKLVQDEFAAADHFTEDFMTPMKLNLDEFLV